VAVHLDPLSRYDMPVAFGPSPFPAETEYADVHMASISWLTARDAAEALIPPGLKISERPVVTISRMTYEGVDYLGGRSYSELTVGIAVTYDDDGAAIRGQSMPVVWLDDGVALIVGRELLGYAKLPARIPPVAMDQAAVEFSVYEYDARLISARIDELEALGESELDRVRKATLQTTVFGWKYIPATEGTQSDTDYLTQVSLAFDLREGWRGRATFSWDDPDNSAAPFSSRIVATLRALPVEEIRPAFVGRGPGRLFRGASRRLS
jgi:acetoacetate decarboxylase